MLCCSVCRIMAVPRAAYTNMKAAFPIGTRKMLSNLAEEAVRVGLPLLAGQLDKANRTLSLLSDKVLDGTLWVVSAISVARMPAFDSANGFQLWKPCPCADIRGLLLCLQSITKHAEKGAIELQCLAVILGLCKAVLFAHLVCQSGQQQHCYSAA